MLVQQMRIAEMDGKTAEKDALKAEADKAKERFTELAKIKKDKEDAERLNKKPPLIQISSKPQVFL